MTPAYTAGRNDAANDMQAEHDRVAAIGDCPPQMLIDLARAVAIARGEGS